MNDGLSLPVNPSYYDRESSFTLNNPIINSTKNIPILATKNKKINSTIKNNRIM